MTTRTPSPPPGLSAQGTATRYRDHILDELRHDPYQAKEKYTEPTACPACGLVFHHARWMRGVAAREARVVTCPACRRIADKLPAGFVTAAGPFAAEHRAEIEQLARNEAKREEQEHPLHRLMGIEEHETELLMTTTDLHLARRIGQALKNAYHGRLEVHQGPDEYLIRVRWWR